jgi:HSP20 family protein
MFHNRLKPNGNEERFIAPPVNICETKEAIIVEAEMPGVDKNHLEVSVHGDELTIVGRRSKEENYGEAVWKETPRYDFRRVFMLGDHVDQNAINASFDAGILSLKLGKAEDVKPRSIKIN